MGKPIPQRLTVPLQLAVVVLVAASAVGTSCSDEVKHPVADAGHHGGGGSGAAGGTTSTATASSAMSSSSTDVGEGG